MKTAKFGSMKTMEKKKQKIEISWNRISELPSDILHQVFSKLSIFDLYACRQVCKSWKKILLRIDSNVFFAVIFPTHRSKLHCIDFDPKHLGGMNNVASITFHPNMAHCYTDIVNSCRGLLGCRLYNTHDNTMGLGILNPITNEFIQLSSFRYSGRHGAYYGFGFGFSPKTKQYKMVRHSRKRHKSSSSLVEIFSITGTTDLRCQGKWMRIGYIPLDLEDYGVYFNGALYWVGTHLHQPHFKNLIYRLDLDDYKLDQFSVPQLVGFWRDRICDDFFFEVLNGDFYLTFQDHNFEYQVWRMELQDYSLWTKVFVFPRLDLAIPHPLDRHIGTTYFQLIKFCQDGKILCLHKGHDLLLYDPITHKTQTLTDQDPDNKKHLEIFSIDIFNLNPLHTILAGSDVIF